MGRLTFRVRALLAAGLSLAIIVAWVMSTPDRSKVRGRLDIPKSIADATRAVEARNAQAGEEFETRIKERIASRRGDLDSQAVLAASKLSTFESSLSISVLAAKDRLTHGSSAISKIERELGQTMADPVNQLSEDVDAEVRRYQIALATSTSVLAYELAQQNPTREIGGLEMGPLSVAPVGQAQTAQLGVAALVSPLDAVMIKQGAKPFAASAARATSLALSTFARPTVRMAASATLPAADGPLPFADVIAAGLFAWSVFDIYHAKHEWSKGIHDEALKLSAEIAADVEGNALAKEKSVEEEEVAIQKEIIKAAKAHST